MFKTKELDKLRSENVLLKAENKKFKESEINKEYDKALSRIHEKEKTLDERLKSAAQYKEEYEALLREVKDIKEKMDEQLALANELIDECSAHLESLGR